MVRIPLLELSKSRIDECRPIINLISLVKASYVLHRCALVEYETTGEDVRLVDVVSRVPRISTILHVCFPESGAEILRGASDSGHGASTAIISISEIILRLTEVNNLYLVSLGQDE